MGKPTGFLEYASANFPRAARRRSGSTTGLRFISIFPKRRSAHRAPAAWIAACPSATPAARSTTSFPTGTIWSIAAAGAKPSACLHATNNFPEFTGRICPAPCEAACVLGINEPPVTIKQIEKTSSITPLKKAGSSPNLPEHRPANASPSSAPDPPGLAAAQQLRRAGHAVTVFEKEDRIGGLLRYGIPNFKMEKHLIDRRLDQMRAEGVEFVPTPTSAAIFPPKICAAIMMPSC